MDKRKILKIAATIVLTLLAILYTIGMRAFGAAFNANGVGSRFFLFLVAGPEGVLLLIWPILAALLPWSRQPRIALSVVCLSLIPFLWTAIVLSFEGVQDDAIKQIWKTARPVIYIFAVFFLMPSLIGLAVGTRGTIRAIQDWRKERTPSS